MRSMFSSLKSFAMCGLKLVFPVLAIMWALAATGHIEQLRADKADLQRQLDAVFDDKRNLEEGLVIIAGKIDTLEKRLNRGVTAVKPSKVYTPLGETNLGRALNVAGTSR